MPSFDGSSRLTLSWTPWFVLVVSLLLTGLATLYVARSGREAEQLRFERAVRQCVNGIEDRIDTYITLSRGAAAFFSASSEVTGDDFRAYARRLRFHDLYPGIQGLGFSERVPRDRLDAFLQRARQFHGAAYHVWPDTPRDEYHAILYLQPEDRRNLRAFGYDMYTEPTRREAMDRARDTGMPAASGKVTLVQEIDPLKQPGFLIYTALYEGGDLPPTLEERRRKFTGFVYSPFRAGDLFGHTLSDEAHTHLNIRVYDTAHPSDASLLYADERPSDEHPPQYRRTETIQIAGRPWTLEFASRRTFQAAPFARLMVPITLAGGTLLSLTLFAITLAQANASLRATRAMMELARSEGVLRDTEERLRLALDAAEMFAYARDIATDRITYIGDTRRILGRPLPTGTDFAAAVHPDDRPAFEQAVALAAAGQVHHELEYRVLDPDGAVHWVRDRAVVELDARGAAQRVVGVCAHITRHKEAEHMLRQLNETLEQRVADRTLEAEQRSAQLRALANELTQAEHRERRRLAQVLHDHLQQLLVASLMRLGAVRRKIDEKAQPALDQVEDLLRQSINASRSLTVELSPPVLYDAGLGRALEWLARSMKEKHGLSIELEYDAEAPELNEDLRAFLFQSVRELLFNVVKHARVNEARVTLHRAPADTPLGAGAPDEFIAVTVEDQGPGFDPAVLRVRGAKAEHFGLFSIQQRLELLGGRMSVESAPDRGASITLYAPLRITGPASAHVTEILEDLPESDEALAAEKLLSAYTTGDRAAAPIRVVLADDHEVLRRGLGAILHLQPDIEVIGEASNGEEVVVMARRLKPDVVVMDVGMPRLDGVRATQRIRAEAPGTRVIGLSVHDHDGMSEAMHSAGAFAYLAKTDPADDLLTLIREAANTPAQP